MSQCDTDVRDGGFDIRGKGLILVDMALMAMMVMFVEIMLVPALPIIAQEFPNDASWISWVLAAYMLVGAVATPLLGRLGDMYGKKRIMLVALGFYLLGLAGCGFAWSIPSLIAFRAVQGIGMGMFALAFGIVRDTFPARLIPIALGVISAMFSVGVSIGLLGGGYIVETFSWRDCYYIVTPLMAGMVLVAWKTIEDDSRKCEGGLDLAGAGLLGLGVLFLLLALTQGDEWGFLDIKTLALVAASLVSFVGFIWWERRTSEPIIHMDLLTNRGILGANLVALFFGVAMFLLTQTLPFFLRSPENLGGFNIQNTFTIGLYMFPMALSQLFFAPAAGAWSKRYGADKVLSAGMAIFVAGMAMLIVWHDQDWMIWASMAVLGVGMGMGMVSFINVVGMAAPKKDFGVASGMNTLFRIIGGSIGPVLATAVMASYAVAVQMGPFLIELTTEEGYVMSWLVGAAFAFVGLLLALVMRPGRGISYED